MIKEVEGNLLTYPGIQVIAHQCNCLGIMGAGIAKQIKEKNPEMFKRYVRYCQYHDNNHQLLGMVHFVLSDDEKQVIANMFGQYSFASEGKPATDYDALKECFRRLHTWMVLNERTTVGVPDHIGCGLAGGDWETVKRMLYYEFEDDDEITLYIVKYNG